MRDIDKLPFVDVSVTAYWVLNKTSLGRVNELFEKVKGELAFKTFLAVASTLASEGAPAQAASGLPESKLAEGRCCLMPRAAGESAEGCWPTNLAQGSV